MQEEIKVKVGVKQTNWMAKSKKEKWEDDLQR